MKPLTLHTLKILANLSTDLKTNMKGKFLVSLSIKSLYTNILVNKSLSLL